MKAFILRTLLVLLSIVIMIQLWIFGSLVWWRTHPVENTMFMRLNYWSDFQPIQHQWVDYDHISIHLKRGVIAAEDGRFTQHHGFDWSGIEQAMQRNQQQERVVSGGSTISQQLAKNLFLYPRRSFIRKGQESIATVMMERMWSKQRILEVYLNVVEFGDHLYGVEAAAQHYFSIPASKVNREQAAFLIALLPSPKSFQKDPHNSRYLIKQRHILKYMNNSVLPKESDSQI
ncbi:monofunctional biosynthetic peptidoglycan transglycosylase [Acinetobacter rudis]|uniref:Biosynthetic peptidoglycan transglycosylase n=1 Tax=Acinetobacter rudis TaxID=632955 RepID=A0AAW8J8K9_9GAMM|nr:monofunctional biosynthetic peptidoglycan transglycosylase [Acinetobacter rudis]MDQ8936095.1 monofunctional biosynthetic peptidoglycan transglycosylase [Acinetobacter rudis]MDQ8953224.1 monofunctional biosynthetic peptidoglycan transglycosylase [Acinetobacter rudis]MDQ9018358.1 monofunctional biosynthetic peptidoglycan transglycosylase [Acinetobacter rudis]